MMIYYGSSISEHIDKTPEGYLICRDVPINRTGTQTYSAGELGVEGDPDRPITVYRLPEDVFAPAALASFEGKDITNGHPAEMLSAVNQAAYSKGHIENVRREGENTVADLIIKDPTLVSDVENGIMREVSCGYNCRFEPYRDGYKQTNIVGNHLAVVPRGRAGASVAIHDAAEPAEKGRNAMNKFARAVLDAFGMAAKDATPEEMEQITSLTVSALDAAPADKAQDADPADEGSSTEAAPTEDADPACKAQDAEEIEAPKGDDIGSKLDRILEMLEAKARGGRGEHRLHDETDLDEMIAKLSGEGEKKSLTIPVEETEDAMDSATKDAAVELLRKVRPAVAAIEDKTTRAKVTDALLSAIKGEDNMTKIATAATDSAQANAKMTSKTTYEQACADAAAAYASRNPHSKKEEK